MQTIAHIRMPENGVFQCRVAENASLMPGDACLVELDYGLDTGQVIDLYGVPDGSGERLPSFRVVRKRTPEDEPRIAENAAIAEKARAAFQRSVSREKGHVKVLYARLSFARERLFIRFAAQAAVDLRRFTGQINRDFKTHVELWQVGVRDEAALVGGVGPCGRAICCCSWQRQFHSVNVRMAKAQEMSLNPITINGSCGRLKCCLRFEYEQYREAGQGMPETGSVVAGMAGEFDEGLVVGRDVMRGRVTVRTRDGGFLTLGRESLRVLRAAGTETSDEKEMGHEDSAGEWSESETAGDARTGYLRDGDA